MNRGSPPVKEATRLGLIPDRDAKTEKADSHKITEAPPDSNIHLLAEKDGICLFEFSRGRSVSYEVSDGKQCWSYGLFFFASAKFDRLIARSGGAQ